MHPLDNPIYTALASRQSSLAEVSGPARRFVPSVSILAGLEVPGRAGFDALARLVPAGETAGVIVEELPEDMPGWHLLQAAPLLQMVFGPGKIEPPRHELVELTATESPEMVDLADLTKPGPFGSRTYELGGYVGILRGPSLVAMAGYRMRVPGFTEISAICTHPDHAGNGYARSLTNALISRILASGETPFLHVRASNDRAIQLYERLGFVTRYRRQFVVLLRI